MGQDQQDHYRNPQVLNSNLIYPGQTLNIPQMDNTALHYENEVVGLVNEICVESRLKPLTVNWELSRIARYKFEDMSSSPYFSPTSPTYSILLRMIQDCGLFYWSAGENITYGQRTSAAVMDAG